VAGQATEAGIQATTVASSMQFSGPTMQAAAKGSDPNLDKLSRKAAPLVASDQSAKPKAKTTSNQKALAHGPSGEVDNPEVIYATVDDALFCESDSNKVQCPPEVIYASVKKRSKSKDNDSRAQRDSSSGSDNKEGCNGQERKDGCSRDVAT
jgi:hypothetical protein